MKQFFRLGIFLSMFAVMVQAQERFSERLSAEQRKATGLDQLSAAQLAALDALVKQDQRQGAVLVREKARAELRAEVKAEVKEQAIGEVRTELQKQQEAATRILSRIAGKFSGWDAPLSSSSRMGKPGGRPNREYTTPSRLIPRRCCSKKFTAVGGSMTKLAAG